jgi:hypothetical protein
MKFILLVSKKEELSGNKLCFWLHVRSCKWAVDLEFYSA